MWPEQVKKHNRGKKGCSCGDNKVTGLISTQQGSERTIFFIFFMGVRMEDDIKSEGK